MCARTLQVLITTTTHLHTQPPTLPLFLYTTAAAAAGHPLPEVRARTLQALDFKLKYGLVSTQELLQVMTHY